MAAMLLSRRENPVSFMSILVTLILVLWPNLVFPQAVRSRTEAAQILTVDKISVREGVVSGEVQNKSTRTLRDVQLFIRYVWLWNDEFHPGKDDPSTAAYHSLGQEISPGGSVRFTFTPSPPLPKLPNGYFETSVSIAGFTEVIR